MKFDDFIKDLMDSEGSKGSDPVIRVNLQHDKDKNLIGGTLKYSTELYTTTWEYFPLENIWKESINSKLAKVIQDKVVTLEQFKKIKKILENDLQKGSNGLPSPEQDDDWS